MNVRRNITLRPVLLGLALLLVSQPAKAVITVPTPLEGILDKGQFIFTAKVDRLDPGKPSAVLVIGEHLKGRAPFTRLPINLTGDSEARKFKQTPQLLKRLAPGLPLVIFVTVQDQQYLAFGYTNGTWFQMTGQETGKDTLVWRFTHCEPYLRRTFLGSTAEMQQVVTDGLSGKKKPPPPDLKIKPGLGPEVAAGESSSKESLLPAASGPPLAVIPSVALGGVLSLLAMLFPAVFGGLTGQLKRWLALIAIASLNSTLLFLHNWFAEPLQGSWWGTSAALWLTMTCLNSLGILWAWQRHLAAVNTASNTLETATSSLPSGELWQQPPFVPGRMEHFLLWVLSLVGLGLVVICQTFSFPLLALPWSFVLALWIGIWSGTLYAWVVRRRAGRLSRPVALSSEGIVLGAMVPACLILGLTGESFHLGVPAGTVEMGASTGGPRYLGTVWAFAADGHGFIVSSPLLAGDRVITAVSYPDPYRPFGKVYCLDRLTGKLIWSFKSDKKLFSSPCLAEGRIYFGEGFHEDCFCKLYCLDAATGKKLWEFETESHTESSPCVSDGKVFFGAGDDGLYCLNALTGEKIWQLKDRLHIDASPLVVGRRLYVGSAVGDQYQALAQVCLDTATGQILWEVPVNLATPGAPTLDGEQVFFGTGNGNFLKRDENPGGAVICRRADNGQMLWQTPLPDSVLNRPAVMGGRVLVGSRDGHCYCLDRSDGHILWKHNLGSPVAAAVTLLTGSSGRSHASLFALGSGGRLACLHPETGEAFWTFDVSSSKPQLFATPAVEVTPWLTEDHRRIYFAGGLQDNTRAVLYCLEDYWPEK